MPSTIKTRLRPISPEDKLIIDEDTGRVLGFAPDPRTPSSMLICVGDDGILTPESRALLTGSGAVVADENGDLIANIGHRRGLYADLKSLDGVNGEITIPTDVDGLMVHNGVEGQAKFYRRLDTDQTLGPESLALGSGAQTAAGAGASLAIGKGANATVAGQIAFGSATPRVKTSRFTAVATTVGTTGSFFTADGSGAMGGAIILPAGPGLYEIAMTILVREGTTDNYARMLRRAVVRVGADGIATAMLDVTSPTGDVHVGLPGLTIGPSAFPGRVLYITTTGIAGKTLEWALCADVVCLFPNT